MAKILTGRVISAKTPKTIVVNIVGSRTHPIYKKRYPVSKKIMAHVEDNSAKVGDLVSLIETRPISARKRFKLLEIIQKAGIEFQEADATADVEEVQAIVDGGSKTVEQTKKAPKKGAKEAET